MPKHLPVPRGGDVEPPPSAPDDGARVGEPSRAELIAAGGRELTRLGEDPDTWVYADVEAELQDSRPKNTADAIRWAYGALIHYCGQVGRRHDPASSGTARNWIKAHWEMTRTTAAGEVVKRGRGGQPYAPATVALRIYLVAMVCRRLRWASPTDDPKVSEQLIAYRKKFERAGFRTHEADPLTPDLSVKMVRGACDLATVNGLRNACAWRLQFDAGCRATEELELLGSHVRWITDDRVAVTFTVTKTGQSRTVFVEAMRTISDPRDPAGVRQIPNPDWDVDPVRLLGLYAAARAQFGLGDQDPFFTEVSHASRRRADWEESGVYAGRILRGAWTYDAYALCWERGVKKSRIDVGPKGTRFHFPTHANRAGMITAAVLAGVPLELVAKRSGHKPGSPVLQDYYRGQDIAGDNNIGVRIRRSAAAEQQRLDAERAVRVEKSRRGRGAR